MSKIENNPATNKMRGMLGGTIVYRQVNNVTICSTRPKKRDKPTEHQIKTKGKFLKAVEYAKQQMALPEMKALYQKAVNSRIPNAYTAALKDFLNAPTVMEVRTSEYNGQAGSRLSCIVHDDFEVMAVKMEIFDQTGRLLESGYAEKMDLQADGWEYKATVANPTATGSRIVITGTDRPGNAGVKEVVL